MAHEKNSRIYRMDEGAPKSKNKGAGKMFDPPKTLKEAKKFKYGTWAGNPKGSSYQDGYFFYEVYPNDRICIPHQCLRKNGHGPAGLYCKQHAKMVEGA